MPGFPRSGGVTARLDFEIRSGLIGGKDPLGHWAENARVEQQWNTFTER